MRLDEVAERFGLGRVIEPAAELHGGVNRVWRLRTERGDYAVHAMLNLPAGAESERCTQVHAVEVAASDQGVRLARPIVALDSGEPCVVLDDAPGPIVVHEWVDGRAIGVDCSAPELYRRLGSSLAQVHRVDVAVAPSGHDGLDVRPTSEHWRELAGRAAVQGRRWSGPLAEAAEELVEAIATIDRWDQAGGDRIVCGHRDLTSENILDVDGDPVLIDWEDAGRIGQGTEIGRTALDNLGRDGELDPVALRGFLAGYAEMAPLPSIGPHWCSLWIRGLVVFAEYCAESCVEGSAPESLLERQSAAAAGTLDELRRRFSLTDRLVDAFSTAAAT